MTDENQNALANQGEPLGAFNLKIDTSIEEANKFIQKEWQEKGLVLVKKYAQMVNSASVSDQPSAVISALRESVAQGRNLAGFFDNLAKDVDQVVGNAIVKRDADSKGEITRHESNQSDHRKKRDEHNAIATVQGVKAGFCTLLAPITGGWSLAGTGGYGASALHHKSEADDYQSKINSIQSDIDRLKGHVDVARKEKGLLPQKISPNKEVMAVGPVVMEYRYRHAEGIFGDAEKYARQHGTSVDKIAEFLKKESPECLHAFMALVRANYRTEDLMTVAEYAKTAEITRSPEQAAFLQFINHSLIPHMDYFQVWASKMDDLKAAEDDMRRMFASGKPEQRPALELFGEKPIALSGTRDLAKISGSTAMTKREIDAEHSGLVIKADAENKVRELIHILNDEQAGELSERHAKVKNEALGRLREFNQFFSGIDNKLTEIETKLRILPGQIDHVDFQLDRAVGIQTSLEMLEARDPARLHAESSSGNFLGEAMRILFEDGVGKSVGRGVAKGVLKLTGHAIGNEARIAATRLRQEREHAILKRAAELRRKVDPEPLKKQLDELEKEYEKLLSDKEFLAYVAHDPALEQTRAMYMLLPRLVAGEGNIDAVEIKAQEAGYKNVDEFIADLHQRNARLGEAMQHYVFGIANTNDLRVIVSEANSIEEPQSKMEKVLVGYVEDVIKERYRDIARQASIMDYLEMRNVIYTGKPFHSFGEIVRYETDAALQALLSGKGDFNLVGSNDVRQIFDYYQDRHGEGIFKSVHEPHGLVDDRINTGKATSKRAHVIRSDEIKLKQKEVISNRHPVIPRVSSIFTEICAHEYLLSQGKNVVKDKSLASNPEYPGVLEMVNKVTEEFVKRLALDTARARKRGDDKNKPEELGHEVECLIAQTFVDFFSELGAVHSADPSLKDRRQKVKNAYTGENYAVPLGTFTQVATASAKNAFDLFLETYQHNLEKYLEVATRDNRKKMLQQLDEVKDLMQHVQPSNRTSMPDSEDARMKAHYRNHSLSNLGVNPSTWVVRAEAMHKGGKEIS